MKATCWLFLDLAMLCIAWCIFNAASTYGQDGEDKCGSTVVKAEARTKYMTTPGFPKAFPGDLSCTWAIYCNPGKRIRLEFQRFLLLGSEGACDYQAVTVKSPFTLFSMGPYCGEISLPTIVSTGNLIYIELRTPFPVTTDNFEGFKVAFKETTESSSYELRPDNSVDDIIMTIDPETMNAISPTPPTTILTTEKTIKTTTRPSRWRPGLSMNRNVRPPPATHNHPVRNSAPRKPPPAIPRAPPRNTYRDSSLNNMNRLSAPKTYVINPKKNDKTQWKVEIIVGIAVGGVVVLAIVALIALKSRQSCKTKENRQEQATTTKSDKVVGEGVEKASTLPAYYVGSGMDQVFYPGQFPDQCYYYGYDGQSYPMEQLGRHTAGVKSSTLPANHGMPGSSDKRRKRRTRNARSSANVASSGHYTSSRHTGGVNNSNNKRARKPRSRTKR